jgi:hypothetical protein
MTIGEPPTDDGAPAVWETASDALDPIHRAMRHVELLARQLTADVEAADAFIDRVSTIEPADSTSMPAVGTPAANTSIGRARLDRVVTAFEETLGKARYPPSVSYDLNTELYREFQTPIADALLSGTDAVYSPEFLATLVSDVSVQQHSREALHGELDIEFEELSTAGSRLADIDTRLSEIAAQSSTPWDDVSALTDAIEAVAAERQAQLNGHGSEGGRTGHELCRAIYEPESFTYPVLTTITALQDRLEDAV